jgi:spermidine/putrescine transport system permease protein
VERHLPANHRGLSARKAPFGRRLAPYLLSAPGGIWLLVFFVIPFFVMFSVSLQTGNIDIGFTLTWHIAEYWQAVTLYHAFIVRSLWYASVVTVLTLIVGYPVAYWIAFHAGRRKTTYLFLLLLPFFVSFVIRTLSWGFILADQGVVLGTLKRVHILPQDFHVIATSTAVIAGIAYNSLPFTVLPLYVSLEKIDRSVLEAAHDLYANNVAVFRKVILPLTVPGIFAAFLLTFIPAAGDYVNATILGSTGTRMVGNIIQDLYLGSAFNYPMASALSFILMAILLVGILAYARLLGTRSIEEFI